MKNQFHLLAAMSILLSAMHLNAQAQWQLNGNINTGGAYIGTNTNDPFPLRTAGIEAMRIDINQNIGIGTATPANLLHLYKPGTSASVLAQISNGNTTFPNGLQFGINSSNEGVINMYDAKPLSFYTANTPRMTILGSTGHVGIGTAAPKERLEVNGSILASGKILIAEGDSVHDLLAQIRQLQNEVNELKAQLLTVVGN